MPQPSLRGASAAVIRLRHRARAHSFLGSKLSLQRAPRGQLVMVTAIHVHCLNLCCSAFVHVGRSDGARPRSGLRSLEKTLEIGKEEVDARLVHPALDRLDTNGRAGVRTVPLVVSRRRDSFTPTHTIIYIISQFSTLDTLSRGGAQSAFSHTQIYTYPTPLCRAASVTR